MYYYYSDVHHLQVKYIQGAPIGHSQRHTKNLSDVAFPKLSSITFMLIISEFAMVMPKFNGSLCHPEDSKSMKFCAPVLEIGIL